MNKIFDTHAHYDDNKFNEDRDILLDKLFKDNVCGIINCGVDFKSSIKSIELSNKYPLIYAAIGIHPHEAENINEEDLNKIKKLYNNKKVVAIGEIGLDYHYDFCPRKKQIEVFEEQLKLSLELDLPVIIHDREAHEDTFRLLKKYKPKGVVHCFSSSLEMAQQIISLGMYIGMGGTITFKNSKKPVDVAKNIDLSRLLLETDAPYITPVPYRGTRCDSSHIFFTAQKISQLRDISIDEVLLANLNNVKALFKIN